MDDRVYKRAGLMNSKETENYFGRFKELEL